MIYKIYYEYEKLNAYFIIASNYIRTRLNIGYYYYTFFNEVRVGKTDVLAYLDVVFV